MNTPLVSVVLPTRNRAATLRESVDSVLAQTFRDFELLVVDDGSTDETPRLLAGISDPRLRVLRWDVSKGVSAARNRGIRESRGRYVAFQDSDDVWMPEKLGRQLQRFERAGPELGVVYTAYWREEAGQRLCLPAKGHPEEREGRLYERLLRGNWISMQTSLVRKDCLERSGVFDEDLPRLVDWDLFLRLSRDWAFGFVNEPLVVYRLQPDSLTAQPGLLAGAYERILEKYAEDIARQPGLRSWHWAGIGNRLCLSGEMREGRAYYAKALTAQPMALSYRAGWLLSFLGAPVYRAVVRTQRRLKGQTL